MKKILSFFIAVTGCLLQIYAQKMYQWEIFHSYHNSFKNVVAKNKVYSLANNNLMSYQITDGEVYLYDKTKGLNDSKINYIEYCEQLNKLVIIYANGNIDILHEDGNITNIPQYKDKNIADKIINGLDICEKYAFLSTGFGLVMIDLEREVILNTFILNKNTKCAVIFQGNIYAATVHGLYAGDMKKNLLDENNWEKVSIFFFTEMKVFDNNLFANNNSYGFFKMVNNNLQMMDNIKYHIMKVCNGKMILANNTRLCIFNNAEDVRVINHEKSFLDLSYSVGTFWASQGYQGLQPYTVNTSFNLEASGNPIIPDSPIRDYFNFINYTGTRMLAVGGNLNYNSINYEGTVMYYDNEKWTNFEDGYIIAEKTELPYYFNTINIAQDPDDSEHHFVTSARTGLYEFQNGKLKNHYSCDNSRLSYIKVDYDKDPRTLVNTSGAIYDKNKNLWLLNNEVDTLINIIKADGTWTKIYDSKLKQLPTCDYILFDRKGRVWINSRRYKPGIYMLDYKGTIDNDDDDESIFRQTITNQDGTRYSPDFFYCMAEDKNGEIWIGTSSGLFVIKNPDDFQNNDFNYIQIKVPRNDGTNLADYLLNNVPVTCITVDAANRKWIGTNSGVYLVSADGLETISHFTTDNSPLLSNNINNIAINPKTGQVMIATEMGLVAYTNDAAEPEESLEKSKVIAYPNPVRPEYNGYITVKGLTSNASVKITSSNGQLITSGTSNGGIFTWNGRNTAGRRVASGVYMVMATDEEGNESVVTKIIMIK